MSTDYDNTNRGAGWTISEDVARATRRVTANIDGREYRGIVHRTGKQAGGPGPDYNLWLQAKENRHETACVGLFKSTKGNKKLAGGDFQLRGVDYWVSVFANTSEHPKSPAIDFSFQRKDEEPQPAEAEHFTTDVEPADDIPF